MLESEAKTKFCPLMSEAGHIKVSGGNLINCLGSACMAWDEHKDYTAPDDGRTTSITPACWSPRTPPEGDCGMKPIEPQCGYPG